MSSATVRLLPDSASTRQRKHSTCRVRCGNQLGALHDYRTCRRVLIAGRFVGPIHQSDEEPFLFIPDGVPLGPPEKLEDLGVPTEYVATLNQPRPHLRVLDQDMDSLKIRCNCGTTRTIRFGRVREILLEKLRAGASTSDPIDILTTEL